MITPRRHNNDEQTIRTALAHVVFGPPIFWWVYIYIYIHIYIYIIHIYILYYIYIYILLRRRGVDGQEGLMHGRELGAGAKAGGLGGAQRSQAC